MLQMECEERLFFFFFSSFEVHAPFTRSVPLLILSLFLESRLTIDGAVWFMQRSKRTKTKEGNSGANIHSVEEWHRFCFSLSFFLLLLARPTLRRSFLLLLLAVNEIEQYRYLRIS